MKKVFKQIAFLITLSIAFSSIQFVSANSDIPADISGKWYEQAAKSAIEKGWVAGYPDGTFRGDNNVTTAEFIRMVNSVFNLSLNDTVQNPFYDVEENTWYYDDVMTAYYNHLIPVYHREHDFSSSYCNYCNSLSSNISNLIYYFKPNDNILRQDAILILSRLEGLNPNIGALMPSPDSKDLSLYAQQDVLILYTIGIVKGDENGYIHPQDNITRAEAVALIESTYNYINDLLPEYIEPQFETEKDFRFGITNIVLKNSSDLPNYKYRIEFDSPKELNIFNYVSPLNNNAYTANFTDSQFINIQYHEKNKNIFIIDVWNYMYKYDGYVPQKGDKVTVKITMINAKGTITKDYYVDWIVD